MSHPFVRIIRCQDLVKKLATSFAFEPMCARHLTLGTLLVAANPVRRARDRSHLLTFRQHPCHRWTRRSPPTSIAGGALAAAPIATTAALSPLVSRPTGGQAGLYCDGS
jgi:hypothetical protein